VKKGEDCPPAVHEREIHTGKGFFPMARPEEKNEKWGGVGGEYRKWTEKNEISMGQGAKEEVEFMAAEEPGAQAKVLGSVMLVGNGTIRKKNQTGKRNEKYYSARTDQKKRKSASLRWGKPEVDEEGIGIEREDEKL